MTTEQSVPLFDENELKPTTIESEVEDLVASLLAEDFISLKKEELSEAIRFYTSLPQIEILSSIKQAIKANNREMENPQLYEPINQIEAFEKSRIPLYFKEDGEIEAVISKVMMYFFPGCDIKKTDTDFKLHLNSVPFRRYSYFSNLVKENSSWVSFISENFKTEFELNERAQTLMREINDTISSHAVGSFSKNPIVFEEAYYNYDEIVISIPYKSEWYMRKFREQNGSRSSRLFRLLELLVLFSQLMHFISDSYREINTAVNEEFEKEKRVYTEKQQQAVVEFEKELTKHIVPVSRLNHKSAEAYALANGIEEVLVPISNNERFTTNTAVGLSVYVREDAKKNQDWLIVPPTTEVLEFDAMEYQGVLNYINYETTSYLATKQKSPHVVGADSQLNTMIDEPLFMDVLVNHYKESASYAAISATMTLLEKFPKAFSKLIQSPETEQKEVETTPESTFTDWLTNTETLSKEKPETIGSLSEAMALLNTHIYATPTANHLIEVGSLINVSSISKATEITSYDELLLDGLLKVEEINLIEVDGQHTVLLNVKLVASDEKDFEPITATINLRDYHVVFPSGDRINDFYQSKEFDTDLMSDSNFDNMLLSFSDKLGLNFELDENDEEDYDDNQGVEVVDWGDTHDETEVLVETFANFPDSLVRVSSSFVFAVNMDRQKLTVYKNRVAVYEKRFDNGVSRDTIRDEVNAFKEGKSISESGISDQRPFILPIYNETNGSVITAIAVD